MTGNLPEVRVIGYKEALDYIWTGLTNYETITPGQEGAPDFDLGRMERFLARLGHPHREFSSIHIAGSKGKGSTAAMLASILHSAHLRVGLFISPHLHTFRERVRVASPEEELFGKGAMISQQEVVELVEELKPLVGRGELLTSFDFITSLAFLHFARQGVELAVVEVGLGGRLDSTNVIRPLVSVITSLSLEHTQVLGNTLEAIAQEKAGIIKEGVPVVSAPQEAEALAVIQDVCLERHAPLVVVGRDWLWEQEGAELSGQRFTVRSSRGAEFYRDLQIPLIGRHQLDNATLALAVVKLLEGAGIQVEQGAIRRGLRRVEWPGRLELLCRRPLVLLDGAHNADSMHRLRDAIREYFPQRRVFLIFGAMEDKDVEGMFAALPPRLEGIIFTRSSSRRAALPERLWEKAASLGVEAITAAHAGEALNIALESAGDEDLICVTGSLYLIGEAREGWADLQGEPRPETDD